MECTRCAKAEICFHPRELARIGKNWQELAYGKRLVLMQKMRIVLSKDTNEQGTWTNAMVQYVP